jgi:hypothetical protein
MLGTSGTPAQGSRVPKFGDRFPMGQARDD